VPKQLVLTLTCPNQPVEIFGDELRLGQILTTLLSNAVKFTGTGGSIQVTLIRAGVTCELSVRDNGKDISAELLPRVFDLFVRESTQNPGGLGVGLTLSKELVALHQDTFVAKSDGPGPARHLPSPSLSATISEIPDDSSQNSRTSRNRMCGLRNLTPMLPRMFVEVFP